MEKIKFGKINVKKIKKVLSDNFIPIVCGIGAVTVIAGAPFIIKHEIKNKQLYDQISSIEYVTENETINLENLYIVEINGIKHLCTRELLKEDEIFNSGQQFIIYKSTGSWVPKINKDIHVYKDIKTKESLCTDEVLLDTKISSVCDGIVHEINEKEIDAETIDSNYIDSFVYDQVKKTK